MENTFTEAPFFITLNFPARHKDQLVQREVQRAASESALPAMRNITVEADALPIEDVQEAAPAGGGGAQEEEEVEKEGDEQAGAKEEEADEWICWGPPVLGGMHRLMQRTVIQFHPPSS